MTDPLIRERIAIVQAGRRGSGYLLTPKLVLTAAHVLSGDTQPKVAVPGGTGVQRCRIAWKRYDEQCDAAILLADESLVTQPSNGHLPEVQWASISGLAAWENCQSVGYPRAAEIDGHPDTEQLVGTLKPGSAILRDRYILDNIHSSPLSANDSPWSGMSGAAVFVDDFLVGIVCGDPEAWGHGRVEAVPVSTLIADSGFIETHERLTGSQPKTAHLRRRRASEGGASQQHANFTWRDVDSVDEVAFGVHRATESQGHPAVPPYVPRDVDNELDRRLENALGNGGLLLVTGDSAAGKTRALFESMKRRAVSWRVCKPDPEAALSGISTSILESGERCLIWLDDLEAYIRQDGLTANLLDEITSSRVAILATMRSEIFEKLSEPEDPTNTTHYQKYSSATARLLRAAIRITVDRVWTSAERERASKIPDSRLADALAADSAHGVAEYLAAGPQMLAQWQHANRAGGNPRGAALVAAAVDLARTGVSSGLPVDALEALHESYLDRAGGSALRPESPEAAWKWASKVCLGITSPLIPQRRNRWRAFDYLVSHVAREEDPATIPDASWRTAVGLVEDARRPQMAVIARVSGRADVADAVLRPLAEAGDIDGMNNLGALLVSQYNYADASRWFRQAALAGDALGAHNLGVIEFENGQLAEARKWFVQAIESGETQSMGPLGLVVESLGDEEEALRIWKRGTDAGDAGSAFYYAERLRAQWDVEGAKQALQLAADGGLPIAALKYAGLLLQRRRTDEANRYIARAYERASNEARLGDARLAFLAGVISYALGRINEGNSWWERAREGGVDVDWQVVENPSPDIGLPYAMVSSETINKLGESELLVLMQGLWAVDCLDCGHALGNGVPAIQVEDQIVKADVRIFHLGMCRFPKWNDSGAIMIASGSEISWISLCVGIPFGVHGQISTQPEDFLPAIIVNPSLESGNLVLDDEENWRWCGLYGPRSVMAESAGLQPFWKGIPAPSVEGKFAARVIGDDIAISDGFNHWSGPADLRVREIAKERGGILVVFTSGFGPGPDTPERVGKALQSCDAMCGWVPLR
ncbi:tetratricopeptide repeat protein [Streptomyces sp. 8N616]|uniref:tetratricopeptide repeat protein n=1 Tax=Streptomyces sp. 8N616 TaxID=3457414 RepID=UPI003FD06781